MTKEEMRDHCVPCVLLITHEEPLEQRNEEGSKKRGEEMMSTLLSSINARMIFGEANRTSFEIFDSAITNCTKVSNSRDQMVMAVSTRR